MYHVFGVYSSTVAAHYSFDPGHIFPVHVGQHRRFTGVKGLQVHLLQIGYLSHYEADLRDDLSKVFSIFMFGGIIALIGGIGRGSWWVYVGIRTRGAVGRDPGVILQGAETGQKGAKIRAREAAINDNDPRKEVLLEMGSGARVLAA
jgi:hypothetical protein